MKLAPSKVMLVVGLAVYGYSLREQFFPTQAIAKEEPVQVKELTASDVSRAVALECLRDPFTGLTVKGSARSVVAQQEPVKVLGDLTLQGVSVSRGTRLAIVNGRVLREGEPKALEPGGPVVCARTIGPDYAVIRAGLRDILLHMEKPQSQKAFEQAAARPNDLKGIEEFRTGAGPVK